MDLTNPITPLIGFMNTCLSTKQPDADRRMEIADMSDIKRRLRHLLALIGEYVGKPGKFGVRGLV